VTTVRTGTAADRAGALRVWRQANEGRGKTPTAARVARVREKLADPAAVLVVADDGGVVGMALAEPGRADDGAGAPVPRLWHLAMVFVDPDRWGQGVGTLLLRGVRDAAVHCGHSWVQVWTGAGNHRARGLYRAAGFAPTGRTRSLGGEPVVQLLLSVR
jgi:GNAT superfamily N-acetyltransferase